MKQFLGYLAAAVIAALVGAVAFGQGSSGKLSDLGKAPAVSFQTLDGKDVSLASLKGKVVVVDFWATWCPPCVAEMPGFQELQTKYADRGVVFIGVSLDRQGPKHVKEFLETNNITYRVAMGDETHVEAFGGFNAIPTTFLIDRDGKIRHKKTGGMERDAYETLLKAAL